MSAIVAPAKEALAALQTRFLAILPRTRIMPASDVVGFAAR
jgi:hypothetical protein